MNNLDHLRELDPLSTAHALVNISENLCIYCPREREHRCDENCAYGLLEFLLSWYRADDSVWKARKQK